MAARNGVSRLGGAVRVAKVSPGTADAAERYLRWRTRLVAKIGRVDEALTGLKEETPSVSQPGITRERVVSRRVLEDLRARLSGELDRLDR